MAFLDRTARSLLLTELAQGMWLTDPWGKRLKDAPISEQSRAALLKMRFEEPGQFPLPKEHGDAVSRRLDSMTLEQHLLERHGISRETVRSEISTPSLSNSP